MEWVILRDLDRDQNALHRIIGDSSLFTVIYKILSNYIRQGSAEVSLTKDDAAKAILYGLGYGNVSSDALYSITIREPAIIECLRRIIPAHDLVMEIASEMSFAPNPQTIGYIFEYFVAYALMASQLGLDATQKMTISQSIIASYLLSNDPCCLCFPDHMCGPDIIYKCSRTQTIFIVQIKFVKRISKQKRAIAVATTNPEMFYSNRKTGRVLKGYRTARQAILKSLDGLEKEGYQIRRMLLIHSLSNVPNEDGVECITQATHPAFFDYLAPSFWEFLNTLQLKFEQ